MWSSTAPRVSVCGPEDSSTGISTTACPRITFSFHRSLRYGSFLENVYGSPPSKAKLLAMIVDKACVLPDEVLMVGDASTDRNAAEEVGTLFYGTGPDLRGGDFPWGPDLTGLDAWIAEHVE